MLIETLIRDQRVTAILLSPTGLTKVIAYGHIPVKNLGTNRSIDEGLSWKIFKIQIWNDELKLVEPVEQSSSRQ